MLFFALFQVSGVTDSVTKSHMFPFEKLKKVKPMELLPLQMFMAM